MRYKIGDILVTEKKPLFNAHKLFVVVYGITQSKEGIKQYKLLPLGNEELSFPLSPDGTYNHSIALVDKWYRKVD